MAAIVTLDRVAIAVAGRTLFESLDLQVGPGDVVGVVGPNGSGKTSLLRAIAGRLPPYSGCVTLAPRTADIGYLPQVDIGRETTVLAAILARCGATDARIQLEHAAESLANDEPHADEHYSAALERFTSREAGEAEVRARMIADRLDLASLLGRPTTELSGGMRARARLASLLVSRYDLLLLDEPTNDLDSDGIEALEEFLARTTIGTVIVSHDRELLSKFTTAIVEINPTMGRATAFQGGFDAWQKEREVQATRMTEDYERYATTVRQLEDRARTHRTWSNNGSRSARRDRNEPDRNLRHRRAERSERSAASAARVTRRAERLTEVPEPRRVWQLDLSLAESDRSGEIVATLTAARIERDGFTLGPITGRVDRGDRIRITGANGSGKTTLLELLTGQIEPTEGSVRIGSGVVFGVIGQQRRQLADDVPVVSAVARLTGRNPGETRTLLAKFGLRGAETGRLVASLSPGERTRATLAVLQARGANVLVLDEPTNHLDLPATEQLESALATFDGTLLVVSHDRRFAANLAVDRTWQLAGGSLIEL